MPSDSLEKPECCPNGNFQKWQCRRGFCYCVDSDGSQIQKEVELKLVSTLTCYQNECVF